MRILGEKIMLRELKEEDMLVFNELANNPDIAQNVVGWSKPFTLFEQMQWYQNLGSDNNIRFSIANIEDSELYGTLIINDIDWKNRKCGLGIKLVENSRGKGIGSESITLALKYIFEELNINRVGVNILGFNIPSQKIFKKNGFTQEGVLREAVFKNGQYHDLYTFGLLKREYLDARNR